MHFSEIFLDRLKYPLKDLKSFFYLIINIFSRVNEKNILK
jgi:hypothetical protein